LPSGPQLAAGQTEDEVRKILGPPSVVMSTASNRTLWLYGDRPYEFLDGKLVSAKPAALDPHRPNNAPSARAAPGNPASASPSAPSGLANKLTDWLTRPAVVTDSTGNTIDHRALLSPGKITVVLFGSAGNPACVEMAEAMKQLVQKYQPGVTLHEVDIGLMNSPTARQYNIRAVPHARVFDTQGRFVGESTSNPPQIERLVAQLRKRS
jgi:protein-disulfide isomerase